MKAVIKALKLPTTFRATEYAKGNMSDSRYVEVAALHSGTAGHNRAFARYLDGQWVEITHDVYKQTIREIFSL